MTNEQMNKLDEIAFRLEHVPIPANIIPTTGVEIYNCAVNLRAVIAEAKKKKDEEKISLEVVPPEETEELMKEIENNSNQNEN